MQAAPTVAIEKERRKPHSGSGAITDEDRDNLQEQLEMAQARILQLEADRSLNKRLVDEHRFCGRCDQPFLKWDGEKWFCLE
jgi:hypothetical protein